ncbi:hypothetical protein BKN14_01020 [Candidatus Gracilibacteria bacterium HOT-871]|nr:hypothetical protein BKN14_01020 [Candidatus Gracilibacteria bacterium HOT-871]
MKKILYLDLDGVLADFESGKKDLIEKGFDESYIFKNLEGFFRDLPPIPGAIEAFEELSEFFNIFILSTAPWGNDSAWSDKAIWVKKYLGEKARKKLILSHRKDLNIGDFLVDDRLANGSENFSGEHIHFGQVGFENWEKAKKYLLEKK